MCDFVWKMGVYTVTASMPAAGVPLRVGKEMWTYTDARYMSCRFPGESAYELRFTPNDSVTGGVKSERLYLNR